MRAILTLLVRANGTTCAFELTLRGCHRPWYEGGQRHTGITSDSAPPGKTRGGLELRLCAETKPHLRYPHRFRAIVSVASETEYAQRAVMSTALTSMSSIP